jgi:crotonobetainyl-CoA:carnitine CoA-transferase CaiB-like acyl-CoA transferase
MHASWRNDGPPGVMGVGGVSDQVGGMILAFAVSSALVARERFGVGQKVDTSQYGSQLNMMCASINGALYRDAPAPTQVGSGVSGLFPCGDGKHLSVGFLPSNSGDKWLTFCNALGWEDWKEDPNYATQRARTARMDEIKARLAETLKARPAREWVERFDRADIPSGVVQSYEDISKDPQAIANNYITDIDDPKWGKQRVVGVVVQMSKTPGEVQGMAPDLGQDTDHYLQAVGYTEQEIQELHKQKAV